MSIQKMTGVKKESREWGLGNEQVLKLEPSVPLEEHEQLKRGLRRKNRAGGPVCRRQLQGLREKVNPKVKCSPLPGLL